MHKDEFQNSHDCVNMLRLAESRMGVVHLWLVEGIYYDPSARFPNRFFIDMTLGMKRPVAANDIKDSESANALDNNVFQADSMMTLQDNNQALEETL